MEILLANFSNYSLQGCKIKATSFLRHYIWQRWGASFSLCDKWVQHVSIRRPSSWFMGCILKLHSQWSRGSVNTKWEAFEKDILEALWPKGKTMSRLHKIKSKSGRGWRTWYHITSPFLPCFYQGCAEVISVMATTEIFIVFLLFGLVTQVVLWAQFAPHFRDMNEILIISNIFICSLKACRLISSLLSCYWSQENYTKIHSDGYL